MAGRAAGEACAGATSPRGELGFAAATFAGFCAVALAVYRRAFSGGLISDDIGYLAHPYTDGLSLQNAIAILDPFGPASLHVANYAPVHLLATALERQIFADDVLGYHLVNVLVHALGASLLVALLAASGLSRAAALLGGALFLVHPANVEAVAWISQLKTSGALVFTLAALLAWPRRPALSTALFASGLLTKASAAVALPVAAVATLGIRRRAADDPAGAGPRAGGRAGRWLLVWCLLLAAYAVPQLAAFEQRGRVEPQAYADAWVQLRSVAAIGARYLAMAASSYGVSAFQDREPTHSPLDPWWLAALPLAAGLAWRLGVVARRGSPEALWWTFAAASFAPVSQLMPFRIPMADRYLYFILPGLIGGTLFVARDLDRRRSGGLRVAAVAAWGLVALFAWQSFERARLWRSETLLMVDSARRHPDGVSAHYLRARRAAREGDVAAAVAALRKAAARGFDRFEVLGRDPAFQSVREAPEFEALVRDLAGEWIARARSRRRQTQADLRMLARAHLAREETEAALAALATALAMGGPLDPALREEAAALCVRLAGGDSGGAAACAGGPGGAEESDHVAR